MPSLHLLVPFFSALTALLPDASSAGPAQRQRHLFGEDVPSSAAVPFPSARSSPSETPSDLRVDGSGPESHPLPEPHAEIA